LRLLLDTHYVLALGVAWSDLSARERQFFEATDAEFFISAASIWEMRIKWGARHPSGERKGPVDPSVLLQALLRGGFAFLPLQANHAATALVVARAHKDPFDEVLLAQAQEEGMFLLTRDAAVAQHPLARTVQWLASP
jgi:PIN domain nuclease of toxin-antitoxin system